ncbi:MAG: hypothetical protein V3T15_00245, partial [Pseudomonadales bacterium]
MPKFDRAYYQRYYRNPVTRAVTPQEFARLAEFVAAYLRYLDIDVRRILDIGCGTGSLLRALGRRFPRARSRLSKRTHRSIWWSVTTCFSIS